ncbi:MAG: Gfo/Idh/MocA family oxidoreductase [Clostridia bacterium]|nr:Gfo/Idh/MocA family oxidoreductase [Clostridia bacterium]
MKKLRVAIIGIAHIHVKTLTPVFHRMSDVYEIVGIADVPPYTEEEYQIRLKLNMPDNIELKIWDDYKELLRQNIDIAVICTDIKGHADIVEEVLSMDIHAVVEKPMTLSMADAKRMYRAHKASKAELIINWPIAWFPSFRKAKELADSGIIGDVIRVHYRSPATCGPYIPDNHPKDELAKLWWYRGDRGGGSICDYAGYGCVLSTWITGKTAKRVAGMSKRFILDFADCEDYSAFTIDFGDAIGLIEGSWSTLSNGEIPTGPVIFGKKGVIVADRFSPRVKVYTNFIPYVPTPEPNAVYDCEPISEDIAKNIAEFILDGKPLYEMVTADFNMKVMAALDAGRKSCESGNIEKAEEPFEEE